jgi:hypothetical protein
MASVKLKGWDSLTTREKDIVRHRRAIVLLGNRTTAVFRSPKYVRRTLAFDESGQPTVMVNRIAIGVTPIRTTLPNGGSYITFMLGGDDEAKALEQAEGYRPR